MARATQNTTTTLRKVTVSIKPKATSGTRPCNVCHGTGRVPTSNWKKKKK